MNAVSLSILCCFVSLPVKAATVVHNFTGIATGAYVGGYFGAQTGSGISITVSYDDVAPDLDITDSVGRYQPSDFRFAASLIGASTIFESTLGLITVDTTAGSWLSFSVVALLPDGDVVFFVFQDDDRSFVTSTDLPRQLGSISDWDSVGLSVVDMPARWPETRNPLDVTVTSIAVPELGTTVGLLCGFTILGTSRRRPTTNLRARLGNRWGTLLSSMVSSNSNLNPALNAPCRPSGASA